MKKAIIKKDDPHADTIIKLAVLAVGGQGGGVLSNWIVDVAERNGYLVQSTSVAGVAQRTGATIYYVEMCPDHGRQPVFSLSPAQDDVDILIASEMMEAGRAVLRGFVTADRTVLIASTHRIAAVSEKIAPGDGRAPSQEVLAAAGSSARRLIAFDMDKIALESGSMISSSLFGALAGSGELPFSAESYEETIRASGRGVEASLRAFKRAFEHARDDAPIPGGMPEETAASTNISDVQGPPKLLGQWQTLEARVHAYDPALHDMAARGLRKVVDYQDLAYGVEYLNHLDRAVALEKAGADCRLSIAAAKHLANALCYDDMIRVADLKTRSTRDARVRRDVGLRDGNLLHVTEYFHPRIEEFCGTLPAALGRYIEARPALSGWIDRRINRGRRVRTDGLTGFGMLWLIGGLRRWRRKLLRHQVEQAHMCKWYDLALATAASDYDLAVEVLNCRRLIKGYSDTHVRAQSKFDRVLSGLELLKGRKDAADWMRRLREAALKDEKGTMLDGALQTIASFD